MSTSAYQSRESEGSEPLGVKGSQKQTFVNVHLQFKQEMRLLEAVGLSTLEEGEVQDKLDCSFVNIL